MLPKFGAPPQLPREKYVRKRDWPLIVLLSLGAVYFGSWAFLFTDPFKLAPSGAKTTRLQEAVLRGDLGEVKRLVEAGADVNELDGYGRQPLCNSVWYLYDEISTYHLEHGGHLEDVGSYGTSCYDDLVASSGYRDEEGAAERRAWIEKVYRPKRNEILSGLQRVK